jgi:hypothetical protein
MIEPWQAWEGGRDSERQSEWDHDDDGAVMGAELHIYLEEEKERGGA